MEKNPCSELPFYFINMGENIQFTSLIMHEDAAGDIKKMGDVERVKPKPFWILSFIVKWKSKRSKCSLTSF